MEQGVDFRSFNQIISNALNFAAKSNNVPALKRLLKKVNPKCIYNRGWTCLHEAAANNSYESLMLILKHKECRSLSETDEGHTVLNVACSHNASLKLIKALLDSVKGIANYSCTENVTPLHIAAAQGRLDLIQLLIDYGANVNVQDYDGDTPIHDAVVTTKHKAVEMLLHAGGDPELKSEASYTPFHLACYRGSLECVKVLHPFVININEKSFKGDTPLILAVQGFHNEVVQFLLQNGADPHIKTSYGELAMNMALYMGYSFIFNLLLQVTDIEKMDKEIILFACKPHYFKLEILEPLLNRDLGLEFFDCQELFQFTLKQMGEYKLSYLTNSPLSLYFNICEHIFNQSKEKFRDIFYLFLMRGVSVDALDVNECPPLVYIHYSPHNSCFADVFEILCEFDVNVDHCTVEVCDPECCMPDAFIASLTSNPATSLVMLPYSLYCEPFYLLNFAHANGVLSRLSPQVQNHLLNLIDSNYISQGITADNVNCHVLPLKHLVRTKIRSILRNNGPRKTTKEYLRAVNSLPLPPIIIHYIRYT
ncbi:hypothetical protein O0L34_g13612 [Tuta absoluta]|nr:hypothetical protein O0L34_g13612 [Tuta absoluta]